MDAVVPVLALGVAALGVVVPPFVQLLTAQRAARDAEQTRLFDYKREAYLRVLRCLFNLRLLGPAILNLSLRSGDDHVRLQHLNLELKAAVAELEIFAAPAATQAANDAVSFYDDALYNNSHKRRNASPEELARLWRNVQDVGLRFVDAARTDLGVRSGALDIRSRVSD